MTKFEQTVALFTKKALIYLTSYLADLPNWPIYLGYLKKSSLWASVIHATKGQLISKGLLGVFNSSKKRTKKQLQVELFSYVFGKNWGYQKFLYFYLSTLSQLFLPCDFFGVNLDLPYLRTYPKFGCHLWTFPYLKIGRTMVSPVSSGYAPGLISIHLQNMCCTFES